MSDDSELFRRLCDGNPAVLLVDDDAVHMELGRVSVERGPLRQTTVTLEDLDDAMRDEHGDRKRLVALLEAIEPLREQLRGFEDIPLACRCVLYLEWVEANSLARAVRDL